MIASSCNSGALASSEVRYPRGYMKTEVSDQPTSSGSDEQLGAVLLAILSIFFLLRATFSGWYIVDSIQQTRDRAALRANGRLTIGDVTDLNLGRGSKETLHYAFTVQGESYSGRTRLSSSYGIVLAKSDHLVIRYLPSDPAINHPDAWEWSPLLNSDSIIIGAFLMAVTTPMFVSVRRKLKLVRERRPTQEVIGSANI